MEISPLFAGPSLLVFFALYQDTNFSNTWTAKAASKDDVDVNVGSINNTNQSKYYL